MNLKMYNINRRKFLRLISCSCCSLVLPSCATVPITERKQLSIIPESKINQQAAAAYENFRSKSKLITSDVDIIIFDHHQTDHRDDIGFANVNPNRDDDKSGLNYLAAAGVVFLAIIGLNRELRNQDFFKNELRRGRWVLSHHRCHTRPTLCAM